MHTVESLEQAVDAILEVAGSRLVVAAPLGLGKPHRLLNALYHRVAGNPRFSLHLLTALSLTPPDVGSDLERRFLDPFMERHFGNDFVPLDYVAALRSNTLPDHVRVEEFYFQSGGLLGSSQAQRAYASLNYTHVARTVARRGTNVLVQKVSREPGGTRLSLSCNPDLSFDFLDETARLGHRRPFLVAEVDPQLPWIDGSCVVAEGFFDIIVQPPPPYPKLFAVPRQPVSDADYAIGLYASTLVKDGGTLQIGIGSLADALSHALVLRHTRNHDYLTLLDALSPGLRDSPLIRAIGGTTPFSKGLYGASEMVNDGFRVLAQAGILTRQVVDDPDVMRRLNRGEPTDTDLSLLEREGRWLDGAFYLGSTDLYQWLRDMPPNVMRGLGMTRVSRINDLYGGRETLEREQRSHARFFNTCMMMTSLGAAVSDGLEDGSVVSGVGGQYNFVAMANALDEGRSALMLRATRERDGEAESNIRWNYGHTTIPRHLRDIAITEYGIADLRGACDEDCAIAMTAIADAGFQADLIATAKRNGKLDRQFARPEKWQKNTPSALRERLTPFRRSGFLPDYPIGCDFTPAEQRLVRALAWLKSNTATRRKTLKTVLSTLQPLSRVDQNIHEAIARMDLAEPRGIRERFLERLLIVALQRD